MAEISPMRFLQLMTACWESKTFLSAVELGLFTTLDKGSMSCEELRMALELHPRSARDFFDALVAIGVLEREDGRYRNTPSGEVFLVKGKPAYCGGLMEMMSHRLYATWDRLPIALKTGERQSLDGKTDKDVFEELYSTPARLKEFLSAMTGISLGPASALAAKFDWAKYKSFTDVGCAQGCLAVQVSRAHPHLRGTGFDLPQVKPVFEEFVEASGLSDRVKFEGGSFFDRPLPSADVITMGHILHDWGLDTKKMLLRKAYEALPNGGALVVYETFIDDDRREHAVGLLMSLNMLIETTDGFDYTFADCHGWMLEAGFKDMQDVALIGPHHMVIGYK